MVAPVCSNGLSMQNFLLWHYATSHISEREDADEYAVLYMSHRAALTQKASLARIKGAIKITTFFSSCDRQSQKPQCF